MVSVRPFRFVVSGFSTCLNFSRRGEVCPVRATGILGIVLHVASREANVDLQGKSLNGKDEK